MATDRAVNTEQATAGPIHLSFRSIKQVVVEPADENRFMMTAIEATRACEQAQGEMELRESFTKVLIHLREWSSKHADKIFSAYVCPGDGHLNVLILTKGEDYQFDFDDIITELDLDLVRQFPWLVAEVIQAPECAREGQIVLEKAIVVYGDGSSPHSTC